MGGKVAVVTHPKIKRLYGAEIIKSLKGAGFDPRFIQVPEGERYKTLKQVERIYGRLIDERFDRKSTLVALGGGVIGDMAGFAAATYLRGIACVQCPTTVVAQVDAGIGGKTGVDHPRGKNLIGAFHQPRLVLVDPQTLATLPRREFTAGLAEVVKYGVILDSNFFAYLEANASAILKQDPEKLLYCIQRSAAMKAQVVEADERESDLRRILNYGHTFGHAIETLTGYRKYKHGEAVAIGMCAAARLAERLGICPKEEVARQAALLRSFGLPTTLPKIDSASILTVMERDKKAAEGEIVFVLPKRIGAVQVSRVDRKEIRDFLRNAAFKNMRSVG